MYNDLSRYSVSGVYEVYNTLIRSFFMAKIAGVFDNSFVANKAVGQLLNEGFSKDDISLIMSEQTRNKLFSSTDDEADRTVKGAASGAAVGGALGALIAGLTAAGSIVTTGGALLIAGPIVAVLSGAGAGAMAGGVAGALIRAGFAADEAERYEAEVKRGKAVVIVNADSSVREERARLALEQAGAMLKAA
jgi:hypothetical protein